MTKEQFDADGFTRIAQVLSAAESELIAAMNVVIDAESLSEFLCGTGS